MEKLMITIILSFPVTGIVELVDKYIFDDWQFAKSICILVAIDTVLSIIKHYIQKDASSESFWKGFCKKICIYMSLMVAADVMSDMEVHGEKVGATGWLGTYLCVAMMVREFISIVENSNAIIPWLPKAILKRLRDFNDKGEYINK